MNTFELHLQSGTQNEMADGVVSFIGEDESGQFGIQANHARIMTCLVYGLARFRLHNDETEYLAMPGGLLYFLDNRLYISTRQYLRSKDYQTIVTAMDEQLRREDENVRSVRESLQKLDKEMLKRLWELKRQGYYES